MDIRDYNRDAWDHQVRLGNRWTLPVSRETIAAARHGDWSILLTPTKPAPRAWFPPLAHLKVLCLASGGGQQGPILAAAGAQVTVFDNSPAQLARDNQVARREGLDLTLIEGDMRDLSGLPNESFDLVVHPCSNCFVPDIRPVWKGVHQILRPGGVLLAGFVNPVYYLIDDFKQERGILNIRHALPYSDLSSITEEERQRYLDRNEPLVFGHTLADQIGGQLEAGLVLTGLYEDALPEHLLSKYIATALATRSVKTSQAFG